jgi:hypothetical protein
MQQTLFQPGHARDEAKTLQNGTIQQKIHIIATLHMRNWRASRAIYLK